MNLELLESLLTTKQLGRNIVFLNETDSTNFHAGRMLKEKKLLKGIIVIADKQTAGRGRLERVWHSDGCLTMTVILEFPKSSRNLSAITLTAGTAIVLAITELTGTQFHVKYPNDIFYQGKKLGGILSELKTNNFSNVLLGVGINVHQENFPDEISSIAVSLKQAGFNFSKEKVAASILNKLEPMVDLFINGGFSQIRPLWLEVNCTIGKKLLINHPGGQIEGTAINIDDDGILIVETINGVEKVNAGDFILKE